MADYEVEVVRRDKEGGALTGNPTDAPAQWYASVVASPTIWGTSVCTGPRGRCLGRLWAASGLSAGPNWRAPPCGAIGPPFTSLRNIIMDCILTCRRCSSLSPSRSMERSRVVHDGMAVLECLRVPYLHDYLRASFHPQLAQLTNHSLP